jgi:signal transduction protein with GAF and PtsI domain
VASHGGVLSRERGIPGVGDCEGLLSLVESGRLVTIDGDTGESHLD